MIHDINMFLKNPYPDAQIYRDPPPTNEDEETPAIAYVKASELAAFFKIAPKRLRSMIADVWLDVSLDDELHGQFFLYKPKPCEDLLLRYLACERLLPLVPKKARVKWERMLADLYYVDSHGGDYATKDATKEESQEWQHTFAAQLDAALTPKERNEIGQASTDTRKWLDDNSGNIRLIHNALHKNIIPTTAAVGAVQPLLPERTTA